MRAWFAAKAVVLATAGLAQAEGLSFRLEGGAALISFADTGIFLLEKEAPPTDVFFSGLESGMQRGPVSTTYRGEVNYDFALSSGRTLRLGLVGSGLQGQHEEETPVYFWAASAIKYSEDGQFSVVHAPLGVCQLVDGRPQPCATFFGSIDRRYDEVMPQVLLGRTTGDRTTWFGIQGFSGRLDETTSGMVEASPSNSDRMITEVGGDATGLLLAVQQERPLPSGALLTLGLGLGGYRMAATGLSYIDGERNPNATRRMDFNGVRAQLAAGIEYPLADKLTIGATIRADLWSAQPRIDMDLPESQCIQKLVCHQEVPGKNLFGLTTDPLSTISFGLSLNLRL